MNVINAVPAAIPVTTPVLDPILATLEFELNHVPETAPVSVVDDPTHTDVEPEGEDGTGLTVTVVV